VLEPTDITHLDGRLARSARTRSAIVESLIELLEGGNVQPTVEDVASRAGVAPRTVFQHYADRDALFAAVGRRRQPQLDLLMGQLSAEGPVEQRIDAVIRQRARVFEWIAPVRRAALLMEPFSDAVRGALEAFRAAKRTDALRVFAAEIEDVPSQQRAELQAAVPAALSWSSWDALRTQQGLDVEAASAALRRTLVGLLACR
jgi:TetR/AcrR family transcriptional regulator of autoinduction and epiphytic fitness